MNPAIRLNDVKKTLGGREVLCGISFTVETGDIFGYLGPNGAGKTTTIRILLGLLQANSGGIEVLGRDITRGEIRRQIGFVLAPDGLYDNMTAGENLALYSRIYGVDRSEYRITQLLGAVGLWERAGDKVGAYSRGMRQRLALARAMVHDPAVLLLDEPTAGVDPSGQLELRELILDVARRENKTVFFSSHNLDEVQRICNRIALIDKGAIRLYGDLAGLRRELGGGTVVIETAGELPESLPAELEGLSALGFREIEGRRLIFAPPEGTRISDLISFLAGRGVKIEQATRHEASLEELYSTIIKEAGQL